MLGGEVVRRKELNAVGRWSARQKVYADRASVTSGIVCAIHVSSLTIDTENNSFTSQIIFTWMLKGTQVFNSQDLSSIRLKGRDVEVISKY